MYLPNPCYPSVTGCHVPWLWQVLPEAAKSKRNLSPYLPQLTPDLVQGEKKLYPRIYSCPTLDLVPHVCDIDFCIHSEIVTLHIYV